MPEIVVAIVRITDEAFPGFVACELVDAHGRGHIFVDKVPVVSDQEISAATALPALGRLACEIESEWKDEAGRVLLRVDTSRPHGIESTTGDTIFELLGEQVSR
jgi:hypothetical protein